MPKSVLHAQAQINTARGTPMAAYTPYLALFIGDPLTGGVEVAAGGYGRQPIVYGAPSGTLPVLASNTNTIVFGNPTADWGEITHLAEMDAIVGGGLRQTYLAAGTTAQRTVSAGDPPVTLGPGSVVKGEP